MIGVCGPAERGAEGGEVGECVALGKAELAMLVLVLWCRFERRAYGCIRAPPVAGEWHAEGAALLPREETGEATCRYVCGRSRARAAFLAAWCRSRSADCCAACACEDERRWRLLLDDDESRDDDREDEEAEETEASLGAGEARIEVEVEACGEAGHDMGGVASIVGAADGTMCACVTAARASCDCWEDFGEERADGAGDAGIDDTNTGREEAKAPSAAATNASSSSLLTTTFQPRKAKSSRSI